MDTQTYPGKGLSLPQLVFALNAELKSMVYSSSLTLDQFSQLTNDILTASTAICGQRNLMAPVNHLPLDVLCLIPLHLASLSNRLRVTFVCRHWRRIFLQHAALWSRLCLTGKMDQLLTKALLERVKGSPLDITTNYFMSPIRNVTLLSPFAQQIRSLSLKRVSSDQVQELLEAISGPFPLLCTLKIEAVRSRTELNPLVAPTLPLFKNTVNLRQFALHIVKFPSLQHFTFPHLTNFDFSARGKTFPVSQLLDFLEALPALQRIFMIIKADLLHEDVPPERIIVLPRAETFHLGITNDSPGCEVTTHISCPSAKIATFEHELRCAGLGIPEDIYPPSAPWNAIAHQFTKGTVEQVVLETAVDEAFHIKCSITFKSSDGATLGLGYTHYSTGEDEAMEWNLNKGLPDVFSQASRTIKNHPLLADVRDLHIKGGGFVASNLGLATKDIGQLLGSMGPLEKLTLDGCDMRPYLDPFLDTPLFPEAIQPASFPPIKELVIIHPAQSFQDEEAYRAAIVRLARSQHTRGEGRVRHGLPFPSGVCAPH